MTLPYYTAAIKPEILLWIALGIGWVIIQVLSKAAKSKASQNKPLQRDKSPKTDIDDFLSELSNLGQEQDEPAPLPPVVEVLPSEEPIRQAAAEAQEPPSAHVSIPTVAHEQAKFETAVVPESYVRKKPAQTLLFPTTSSFASAMRRTAQSALIASLKTPVSRRQAIVYRDIMGAPKALRSEELFTVGRGE